MQGMRRGHDPGAMQRRVQEDRREGEDDAQGLSGTSTAPCVATNMGAFPAVLHKVLILRVATVRMRVGRRSTSGHLSRQQFFLSIGTSIEATASWPGETARVP